MLKPFTFVLLFVFFVQSASAQKRFLSGFLKDSLTQLPISSGIVSNSTANKKVRTDALGYFVIEAAPNDLLYVIAPKYRYDTLRFSAMFRDTITIYLPPAAVVLENVTVMAGYDKYRMDSLQRRGEFEKALANVVNAIEKNRTSGFGLIFNLDHFYNKRQKDKRKSVKTFSRLEQQQYIDFRFSPQIVAFYTGLKGDELRLFMQRYTPTYEWLRQHPMKEQLIDYLSEKIKDFKNTKPV